ncbi:unnamed protein product [Paramecium sonneborni]|uniref:Uncharacterized protein n=1 Tax=Paramecium sonneborni TaxID=65129 RepID=A0A8S1QU22_9CILI|nr:unnamed protein product [Paramecium sonneborni]
MVRKIISLQKFQLFVIQMLQINFLVQTYSQIPLQNYFIYQLVQVIVQLVNQLLLKVGLLKFN